MFMRASPKTLVHELDIHEGLQWAIYNATLCLPSGKGTPLILGLFHIHSMLGWFVPMVHVHEGKVGAQSDEYFISRSSR